MHRKSLASIVLLVGLSGCVVVEREGMTPLPANGPALSYEEMLTRARNQAGAALDAFYLDNWAELERAAVRLEESAKALPKSGQVPDGLRAKLANESEALRVDAVKLQEAARGKSGTQANEAMQRINQRIRQLRPQEKRPEEPRTK